jgi:phenylalanyl-tRNA synthetase beta chain
MIVSYKWLNEFIETGMSPEDMAHALTMAGLEIEGLEPSGEDFIFEVNVTPNRSDCLSVLGIARELRAITGKPLKIPEHKVKDTGSTEFRVEIKDPELCNRYAGRVVRGIKMGPSPDWMKEKLEKCGIRSINNIVDITNYVLLELGHPLHAFDLSTLKGGVIKVGVAGKGNSLTTLDGTERKLPVDALMIWDGERPVAVAGVMGGAETEVSDITTDIFIESAWFLPASVRNTSKALGLSTEASYRFERGTDALMLEAALDRTAQLVSEIAGGTVEAIVDEWPLKAKPEPIKARYSYINRLLGTDIPDKEMLGIISRLDMEIKKEKGGFTLIPPAYRPDMTIEADIAEEVARLYGYDNIPTLSPVADISPNRSGARQRGLISSIREALMNFGYHDAVNYSFMNPGHLDMLSIPKEDLRRKAIAVANPLRAEDGLMRTTLVPTLVSNLAYNVARGASEVRLFENSKVFIDQGGELPEEPHRVGGVYWHSGSARELYKDDTEAFYRVKGTVESLMDMLRIEGVEYVPSNEPFFHPGKSADLLIDGKPAGYLGVLSPNVMEAFEIKTTQEAVVFELDLDLMIDAAPEKPVYTSVPRYPAVERDVALMVDREVTVANIISLVKSGAPDIFESVELFDCYTGKGVPEGKKSLAFNLVYRSPERTLTDGEVEAVHNKLIGALVKETGGAIRGS